MISRLQLSFSLVLVFLSACTLRPQPDPGPQIEAYLDQLADAREFSGAVLVAREGDLILKKGYGLADREAQVPNTPQTRFRIHMVTMQFTAMAILMLEVDGRLAVDDYVCEYFSECPETWEGMTIHHLLTHTSGLSDMIQPWEGPESPSTALQMVEQLKYHSPNFEPGGGFRYSTNGYLILGAIIEQVSSLPYLRFMEEHIFEPLGMSDTGFDDHQLAAGYRQNGDKAAISANPFGFSATGLISTVEDMYRWDQALYDEQFIPQEYLDRMFTGYAVTPSMDFAGAEYGYGWFVGSVFHRPVLFHGGGMRYYFAMILRFPEERLTIIVLRNYEVPIYDRLEIEIAKIVFGES